MYIEFEQISKNQQTQQKYIKSKSNWVPNSIIHLKNTNLHIFEYKDHEKEAGDAKNWELILKI